MIAFSPKFVHNYFINIYQAILKDFAKVSPRVPYKLLVTTYQKAIELLHAQVEKKDIYALKYPLLILQPNTLQLDEQVNNLWRAGNKLTEFVLRDTKALLKFGDFEIVSTTLMYNLSFDIFYLGESHLEILDVVMAYFRAFNKRYNYKTEIPGYIYLTESALEVLKNYDVDLEYLLQHPNFLFKYESKYNESLYLYYNPCNIFFKILDITDGSNYMGEQELPSYRVQCSCTLMVNIPNEIYLRYVPKLDLIRVSLGVETQIAYNDIYLYNYRPSKRGITILQVTDFDNQFTLTLPKTLLDKINLSQLQIYYCLYNGQEIILTNNTEYCTINIDERNIVINLKNVDATRGFIEVVIVDEEFAKYIAENQGQEILDGFKD